MFCCVDIALRCVPCVALRTLRCLALCACSPPIHSSLTVRRATPGHAAPMGPGLTAEAMQQSAASSSSRDHQTGSAAQPSAAEISLSTAQNISLCMLLTSCLREKYQTGATQSLRSLVNTARRLKEPGYTYAQAARVVRHSLREGQPRYVWTCKNEGTDQEDLMFNLTSETMVSRRNRHRLPFPPAPPPALQPAPPALQPAPPAALQMAPSEPHMQPAAAPSLQPTHLATPSDPQPDLVEHHTHINNFLQRTLASGINWPC